MCKLCTYPSHLNFCFTLKTTSFVLFTDSDHCILKEQGRNLLSCAEVTVSITRDNSDVSFHLDFLMALFPSPVLYFHHWCTPMAALRNVVVPFNPSPMLYSQCPSTCSLPSSTAPLNCCLCTRYQRGNGGVTAVSNSNVEFSPSSSQICSSMRSRSIPPFGPWRDC